MPNNVPSLCIPRVFNNIDEKRIHRILDELKLGEIKRIDIVSKKTAKGEIFNRVFIHFKQWFSNENADIARDRLLNGKEIKIIYDGPWFWKISAYREQKKNFYKKSYQNPNPNPNVKDNIEDNVKIELLDQSNNDNKEIIKEDEDEEMYE